jgi:putative FmdB family regulatory protein
MPTYEYACKGCGEHLEVVQSFRDDALTECPTCHGELRKVFSAAGLIFKGSGWHVKDYASPARGKKSAASSEGGSRDTSPDSAGSNASSGSGTSGDAGASGGKSAQSAGGSSSGAPNSTSEKASA